MREKRGKDGFLKSIHGMLSLDFWVYLLIALFVLVIIVLIILSLTGKATGGIDFIKRFLFGG